MIRKTGCFTILVVIFSLIASSVQSQANKKCPFEGEWMMTLDGNKTANLKLKFTNNKWEGEIESKGYNFSITQITVTGNVIEMSGTYKSRLPSLGYVAFKMKGINTGIMISGELESLVKSTLEGIPDGEIEKESVTAERIFDLAEADTSVKKEYMYGLYVNAISGFAIAAPFGMNVVGTDPVPTNDISKKAFIYLASLGIPVDITIEVEPGTNLNFAVAKSKADFLSQRGRILAVQPTSVISYFPSQKTPAYDVIVVMGLNKQKTRIVQANNKIYRVTIGKLNGEYDKSIKDIENTFSSFMLFKPESDAANAHYYYSWVGHPVLRAVKFKNKKENPECIFGDANWQIAEWRSRGGRLTLRSPGKTVVCKIDFNLNGTPIANCTDIIPDCQ